ncbi:MAG: Two component transcriptional regulator, LuxR family [Bacteroidetes bacterium 38_7]|nr:MAG: Two component transcriptional regulator, LuxR family [Bacteroidetes bacterium 38_7]HAL63975.1 DNA-binding response regulator [Bacteroidales bacterium]
MNELKIRVLLVDDHVLVRQGIKSLLDECSWIEVVGEVSEGNEMFHFLRHHAVDVILMDINLPHVSGIELTKKLGQTAETSNIKVIILSMFTQEEYIIEAAKAGAKGYLPKNASEHELLEAIHSVADGREFFSPQISGVLLKTILKQSSSITDDQQRPQDILSKREIQILTLLAQGLSNPEISEKLFISIRTVESHKTHILQKLKLRNNVDLVKYAIKHHLIEINP